MNEAGLIEIRGEPEIGRRRGLHRDEKDAKNSRQNSSHILYIPYQDGSSITGRVRGVRRPLLINAVCILFVCRVLCRSVLSIFTTYYSRMLGVWKWSQLRAWANCNQGQFIL